jgi:hypothetical protein
MTKQKGQVGSETDLEREWHLGCDLMGHESMLQMAYYV